MISIHFCCARNYKLAKMFLYNLKINFEKVKIPDGLLSNISRIIAQSFSQNAENVYGSLVENVHISLSGSTEPMVFLTIQTIQDLNAVHNQACVGPLTDYLSKALSIPKTRILVYMMEKVISDAAINGSLLIQYM